MELYKSVFIKEDTQKLHEMSFIRGADLFLGGIKDFDADGISSLDKRNKDKFVRFCKSMKLFYKHISYKDMLEKEIRSKISDWNELDQEEQNRIKKLVILLDASSDF